MTRVRASAGLEGWGLHITSEHTPCVYSQRGPKAATPLCGPTERPNGGGRGRRWHPSKPGPSQLPDPLPASWDRAQGRRWQGSSAHSEEVIKALGVSTELGQVVHEAVALLIGEQVHQVAGIHSCRRTPCLGYQRPTYVLWGRKGQWPGTEEREGWGATVPHMS